jgi:hypothetical protein
MSARCGQTFQDTFNLWKKYFPADQPIPFVMLETWNDYDEGSAIEPGIPTCAAGSQAPTAASQDPKSPSAAEHH